MLSFLRQKLLRGSKQGRKLLQSERRSTLFRPSVESLESRKLLAFIAPVSYPVGTNPAGIAVGDYNADGRQDMAIVNSGLAATVSVLMSSTDGSFLPRVDYGAGANGFDATTGDLNGDGKLDLVIVGSNVDVLLGNGDGTFATPIEYPVTPSAHSIKLGDFNNDGKLDVGTMNSNSASVLLGNGDGSLQAPLVATVLGNNINLVVGDYNHDGNLDMATSNTASNGTINVLRGRGDGSFEPYQSYYAFSAPVYLAQGDFNHDGYLDFACPNSYAATSMSVLLNNGDGTYSAPHTYGIAQTGYEIEVADFNNDGNDDFAVRGGSQYMVSHGKGDGTFYPSVNFPTPSGRFEAGTHGDFNGDGAVDLAYPSTNGVTVVSNDNADGQNLAGAVTFQVTAPATTTSGSVLPMTISAVDANGNVATGFRGVVYISSSDPLASTASGYAFNPLDAGIPYLFTAGDAGTHTFTGAIRLVTAGDQTVTVSAPNMVKSSATVNVTGQVTRLNISASPSSTAGDTFNVTVSALDTTNSVAPGYSSTIHFTSTDGLAGLPADYSFTPEDAGSHTFAVTLKTAGAQFIRATEAGGKITGGVSVSVSPQVASTILMAGGAGAIGVSRPISVVAKDIFGNTASGYSGTVHFTSSDAAAKIPADVALVNGVANVNVTFLTVGTQTFTATDVTNSSLTGTLTSDATPPVANSFTVSGYPATVAGTTNNFTVSVVDTIGQTATGYTGTIYFSSSDIQAGLPASYTFTTADAGTHQFAATLKTAGLQSISVQDASGALRGTQAGIGVQSAAFSKFQLSVPNGADSKGHVLVTAGEAISLKVKAVDNFGNLVAGFTGTVGVTSTDTLASLPGAYSFTATDAGEHTFTVELRTATPADVVWAFNVVDLSNAATLVTMTNFEVVNASAANFVVTLPTNIEAGSTIDSKVTVRDAFGNTVKNYFGTVHFTTTSANATLPEDYTFNSGDLGVHTFSLSLNTGGVQSLNAVDTTDTQVIGSGSGTVTGSVATHFGISVAGSPIIGNSVAVTVSALDAFGNVSSGYRGSMTLRSSDAAAVLPASYAFRNNDAGVHTFNVTFQTAGVQSLSVMDDRDASILGVSAPITVKSGGPASAFVVSGFTSTTAGATQSFTVKVRDAQGNVANDYIGTVVFSSSDVKAGLPASYTFTAADAGVHTFTTTLKTAGVQSISVKDANNGAILGSLAGITVNAAAAASFKITMPSTVTQGVGVKIMVTAVDAFGNIATSYRGKVTLSSTDPKGGTPSYSFSSKDNGVATISYTFSTLGAQTLRVVDTTNALLAALYAVTVVKK